MIYTIIIMSKMSSLLTYFIVIMTIIWGIYYVLLFYGYEQALIFLQVYTIYYIFLFITVFFAIIFNSYTGGDDETSMCYSYQTQNTADTNNTVTQPLNVIPTKQVVIVDE